MSISHSHSVIQDEELLPVIFHGVVAEVPDQKCYGCRFAVLVFGRKSNVVLALVGEEHLQASAVRSSASSAQDDATTIRELNGDGHGALCICYCHDSGGGLGR